MNELLDAALTYVSRGWHVFPLHSVASGACTCGRRDCSSPGKHPLTRHGLKDASTDPDVIKRWWTKWRHANIGVATGQPSGIVVVDLDLPLAVESLDRLIHKLPKTLTGFTGGGGAHLIYRRVSPLRCTTGRLPGIRGHLPGIDLRADGGYIVVAPSVHVSSNRYEWLDQAADIVDAPAWLGEPPRHETPVAPPSPPRYSSGDGTPYGLAALERALTSLAQAPVGQRNHTLNRVAFGLAQLVAGGELLDNAARAELTRAALAIGLNSWETARTIASGFDAGLTKPRSAPSVRSLRARERVWLMPRISFFRGISIYMHFSDHPTPHFHAIYAEYEAKISIATKEVIEGSLPAAQRRLVATWARMHSTELMDNWNNARERRPLDRIEPLP